MKKVSEEFTYLLNLSIVYDVFLSSKRMQVKDLKRSGDQEKWQN